MTASGKIQKFKLREMGVDLLGLHVDRNVADRLHRVGVEPDAPFAAELADLGDRQDGADLVIRVHDRHERRVGADGVRDLLRRDEAPLVHRQVGDLEALLFECRAGVQHRMVLEHRRDDVFFALGGELVRRTLDRPVIALRAAAGEVDLVRLGAERGGGLFARILDGEARAAPELVDARRVAVALGEPGHHRLEHLGGNLCCRGVVRVYKPFHSLTTILSGNVRVVFDYASIVYR